MVKSMSIKLLKDELKHEAARMHLRKLNIENVQKNVDGLMNLGVYYDEFIDIVYPKSTIVDDFIPVFEAVLSRLEIDFPKDKEEAVWVLLKKCINDIASKAMDPIYGLEQICSYVYCYYDFGAKAKKYLGDSHGIEHLLGLY